MAQVKYDLGRLRKGSTVVVQLSSQANVLLMDSANYRTYISGRGGQVRYLGGLQQRSPARLPAPNDGPWYIAIDLGGYAGQLRSSVAVEPPLRAFLQPMRDTESVAQTRRNTGAASPPDARSRVVIDEINRRLAVASRPQEVVQYTPAEQELVDRLHKVVSVDDRAYASS